VIAVTIACRPVSPFRPDPIRRLYEIAGDYERGTTMSEKTTEDVQAYEEQKELKRAESAPSHKDGREFPSSDDVALRSEGALTSPSTDVPDKGGRASDVEESPDRLHGSLHGRWNASGESEP
jgi:hypothetical protein